MFLSPVREIVASRQARVKVNTEQPENHHWRGSQGLALRTRVLVVAVREGLQCLRPQLELPH